MISTPAQVAELQKSQLDALFALSHTVFEGDRETGRPEPGSRPGAARRIGREGAGHVRRQGRPGTAGRRQRNGPAGPRQSGQLQPQRLRHRLRRRRRLLEIFETQIAQNNKQVAEMIELASKNTPTGAEPAVSMFKSALAAATPPTTRSTRRPSRPSTWPSRTSTPPRRDGESRQRRRQAGEGPQGSLRQPGMGPPVPRC